MKIARLSLLAYGPFTGRVLEFGSGLQLVYGPNEAGKSTMLRALIALLYGIPLRTGDAHVHDMTRLRIGASLVDEQGAALSVVRRKGAKHTLLDEQGQPLGDAVLAPWLGGLDEALFQQMFGLDHERLRRGAEELLRGGGQLGEVLFDASTGGRGVHKLIDALRGEAEALFKARGRTPELNAALESLREQKKRRSDAMLSPQAFAEQQRGLSDARSERERVLSARQALLVEKSRLERTLSLVPLVARRDALASELAALCARSGSAPEADAGLDESVRELERRYGSVRESARAEPQRRAELVALERDIEELRQRLGPGAEGLAALETATRVRLRKHVDSERALRTERAELLRQDAMAEEEARRVELRLEALGDPGERALASLATELAREDLSGQLARAEAELSRLAGQLARVTARLGLERELSELAQLSLPSEPLVAELERAWVREEREIERRSEQLAQLATERAQLERARRELLERGAIATPAQLAEARAARDAAFDGIMRAVATGEREPVCLVRDYGAALARSDELADRLCREAQRASELSRLDAELARAEALATQLDAQLASARAALAGVRASWAELVAPLGLALHAPEGARPVLLELAALREQARDWVLLDEAQRGRVARARARRAELAAVLGVEDTESPDDAQRSLDCMLRQLARELTAREEQARERDALRTRMQELASARAGHAGRLRVVDEALEALRETYRGELSALGLPPTLASDELLACLDELTLLGQKRRDASALEAQLAANLDAQNVLAQDVRALAARHLPEVRDEPVERVLSQLASAQRERREARRDQERLRAELEKLDAQLTQLGDGAPLERLRATVADCDPHTARASLVELEERIEAERERLGELDQNIGRLEAGLEHLEQVSGAAALAEDFEQDLARARALARRYVEVRLALALLSREVERYRTQHQAPLLARASELFPRLTLGRYRALAVEYDERDEPVLSCVLASGKTARVAALSDGTRDQLYLALRVASIERYFEGKPPLPLILDDALIHFDDARATAALSVLGELSSRTQVLFFTHHARMIELARAALGADGVQVHDLGAEPSEPARDHGPLFSAV